MEIIPVLDIYQSQVVHAVKGERDNYQPLQSKLCNSCSPEDIVQAFVGTFSSKTIYIADLDAIISHSDNESIIQAINNKFSSLNLWVDQGLASLKELESRTDRQHVIGSETNITPDALSSLKSFKDNLILSLDFRGKKFLGDKTLFENIDTWPDRIILMNLSQVGSESGPDYELIASIKETSDDKDLYVAGGIRHDKDLNKLDEMNISGVLIATALHKQQLSADTIKKFTKKNAP